MGDIPSASRVKHEMISAILPKPKLKMIFVYANAAAHVMCRIKVEIFLSNTHPHDAVISFQIKKTTFKVIL